jgi:uncharacterized membrane protein YfcA
MIELTDLALAACLFLGAALYTSVGHAGASAYIAIMALFGVPAQVMRPTALALNVLVSGFTSTRFIRAGLFRWRTLWPFAISAIPMAWVGGGIDLPGHYYRPLVGIVLFLAAAKLLWPSRPGSEDDWQDPPIWAAVLCGGVIGLLSGLTGTGGGIFLSPILLLFRWSAVRAASGVASAFILVNSISALAGNWASVGQLPDMLPLYAGSVLAGALIGTTLGIRMLPTQALLKALGLVLVVAGMKMIGVY